MYHIIIIIIIMCMQYFLILQFSRKSKFFYSTALDVTVAGDSSFSSGSGSGSVGHSTSSEGAYM